MEQIEEILSCEENSAGVRLKELVEALELEVTNQNLLKVTSILHMNQNSKNLCIRRQSCYYAVSTFTK